MALQLKLQSVEVYEIVIVGRKPGVFRRCVLRTDEEQLDEASRRSTGLAS
jgi:hypothetical protein